MGEERYFLIRTTEDGDVYFDAFTKGQLLDLLNVERHFEDDFGEEIPDSNVLYWGSQGRHRALLIKGKIVVPQTIQVATEYDIE